MLRAFLGVIVAWLTARALGPVLSLWLGATVGLVAAAYAWRGGRAKLMDIAAPMLVVLLALARLAFGDRMDGFGGALLFGGLAVVAAISVALGRPFTAAYGRERSPAETHDTPTFRSLHRTMSLGWAAGFALMSLWSLTAARQGWSDSLPAHLVPIVFVIAGERLSERFAQARLASRGGSGVAADA